MAAPSKNFTSIADAAIDPDSPITTGLLTQIRDSLVHLEEWLGHSFTAAQDHNHDGVNSALVPTGPNALRNASFEDNESGWTFTDYSGGSHGQESANDMHGANSMAFTSTVLANGGGYALSSEFIAIGGSIRIPWSVWLKGSVANVSARLELVWYDDAQAQISTTSVVDLTNTPTAATYYRGDETSPASARFVKLRITGGVPAAGTATGTVYFDGLFLANEPVIIQIRQADLATTTGSVSTTGSGHFTLPGGTYGFYPQHWRSATTASINAWFVNAFIVSTAPTTYLYLAITGGGGTVYSQQRYVQASPPYDLGNGEIPFFAFAAVDSAGDIIGTYCAEDPPWANNGPTNTRPDFMRGKVGYQWAPRRKLDRAKLAGPDAAAELAAWRNEKRVARPVTQAIKNADMALIPHPFSGQILADAAAIVLIDPAGSVLEKLRELQSDGENVSDVLHEHCRVGNTPTGANAPPGVIAAPLRWKGGA